LRGKLKAVREKIAGHNSTSAKLRKRLKRQERELADLREKLNRKGDADTGTVGGIEPEDIVWIFCTGRSGSTWLASMLGEIEGNAVWDEPLVGALFGEFYERRAGHKRGAKFIMSSRHKDVWLEAIQHTVLGGATARFPALSSGEGGRLVIKEPHGSVGAPLLVDALPKSAVVLLIRDPRDVIASAVDAHKKGSWISRHGNKKPGRGADVDTFMESDSDPIGYVGVKIEGVRQSIEKAKEAYDAHRGPKVAVTYEELRADTPGAMRRICSALRMDVPEKEVARVVQRHAWENIPEEKRGEGKFYRKATPGAWKDDLTPEQVGIVEEKTAHLLDAFYPGWKEE
jgi:hypothetical protein